MMDSEILEDIIRARASNTGVPQPRINIYTEEPSRIEVEHRFKLVKDPHDYELEYKKLNVWSYKDIKTFVVEVLRQNKKNCFHKREKMNAIFLSKIFNGLKNNFFQLR